jgi:hypothetical protein
MEGLLGERSRVVVPVPGPPGFSEVNICRELFGIRQEIDVGDQAFDTRLFVLGPVPLVTALLNDKVRRLMLCLSTEGDFVIADSTLRVEASTEKVSHILHLLLELRRHLAQPLDVPHCLAQNARRDSEPGVRLRNLLLLLREYPGDASTAEAFRAARKDASPEVRLRAAVELGAQGRDTLLELAESSGKDVWSAKALSALGGELSLEQAKTILARSLQKRHLQTACTCLAVLGRHRAAAVDELARVLAREEGELAMAAVQALGATGEASAEPPLLLALQREDAELLTATAEALGRVGSAAAVVPLKEAAEQSWLTSDQRRAARKAVAEIQARLQGSPGELSLAESEAGQLSLAEAEEGKLSLASDPAGQLSIPRKPP